MSSCQMFKSIVMQKLIQNFLTKNISCSPWRYDKTTFTFFRITPHNITQRPVMRNFHKPIQAFNLFNRLNHRRKTTMNCKYRIVNDRSNRQIIKYFSKKLPNNCISVLCLALHVKAIILSNCSCLMITSYHHKPLRVLDFQQTKQSNDFNAMSSSINIITKQQVVSVWQLPSNFKYLQYIVELPMDVSNYCYRRTKMMNIFLLYENILEFVADQVY